MSSSAMSSIASSTSAMSSSTIGPNNTPTPKATPRRELMERFAYSGRKLSKYGKKQSETVKTIEIPISSLQDLIRQCGLELEKKDWKFSHIESSAWKQADNLDLSISEDAVLIFKRISPTTQQTEVHRTFLFARGQSVFWD